jgi:interferon gamma-inducible protein 30
VAVDFYEESLCPFCAKFTTDIAAPLFENGLSEVIDFRLIPYGNAKNTSQAGLSFTKFSLLIVQRRKSG